jgi:hypothetical protein
MWAHTSNRVQAADPANKDILGFDLDARLFAMPADKHLPKIKKLAAVWGAELGNREAAYQQAICAQAANPSSGEAMVNFAFADKMFMEEACGVMAMLMDGRVVEATNHYESMAWWDSRAAALTQGRTDPHTVDCFKARRLMRYVSACTIRAIETRRGTPVCCIESWH